ncbi:MAG: hypothetical protein AAGB97_05130 [Dehalococcoidia bacterium]|nr:hypothetical protein [Chloroflexota bacterium]MBT9161796.1 hypothetical protein [Chloroflexota bacterium]
MKQAQRTPIDKLIAVKEERPETTLSLAVACKNPIKTVSTYVFTDSIRGYFSTILESVATGRGQGFWVPAEWGYGKTHFLATIASLLSDTSQELWSSVQDREITNYHHRLQNAKLFPVILSLRGEGPVDISGGRSLLQIIEKQIGETLDKCHLQDRVVVTSAEEIFAWFNQLPAMLKGSISSYVRQQMGVDAAEYAKEAGREALARLIRQFCIENTISPQISVSTKERFSHIYDQLTDAGYNGLLFVIDEFAFWQDSHPEGSPEYAHDEEVLETLAFVLPKELGLRIYTLVASQKPVPVKLRGSHAGDRFIDFPLLGGRSERDYDLIVSRRVRDVLSEMTPEINQYYDYYFHNFEFMKGMDEDAFRAIFPFQPRCFEVLRHITARGLATTRIGINVLYDVIDPHATHNEDPNSENNILAKDRLITVGDLLLSDNLIHGLREVPDYRLAYQAYATALNTLPLLDLDEDQASVAQRVVKTLFLWHLAYLDSPRQMSLQDLTQATLTTEDILKPEDTVNLILAKLRDLPQISYTKEKGASFVVQVTGLSAPQRFNEIKQRITEQHHIQKKWRESLYSAPSEMLGESTLFADLLPQQLKSIRIENRRLEYSGEVILSDTWRPELGQPLYKEDHHFKIVILMENTDAGGIAIEDERIAVCIPNGLSELAHDAVRDYMAICDMEEIYRHERGSDAEQIREWVRGKKPEVIRALISSQPKQYQSGKICTRSALAIEPKEVFSQPSNERRFALIANALLDNAYTALPRTLDSRAFKKTLSSTDVGKVFNGFFRGAASAQDTSALDNFALGLHLAATDNRRKFAPAANAPVFDYLKGKLGENEGHLPTWQVYRDLSNIPYGLPFPLISLYILCFTRYGMPAIDLYLKPNHPLILRSGSKPLHNKLTSATVPELEWKTGLDKYFDAISLSTGPTWNEVVPFARVLRPELKTTADPVEIEGQAQLLQEALGSLHAMATQIDSSIKLLSARLEDTVDAGEHDAVSRITDIVQAPNYAQFYQAVQDRYTQPDAFAADISIYRRWENLSKSAAEILAVKNYLNAANLRDGDLELRTDLLSLRGQLNLKSFLNSPSLWPSVKAGFNEFKRRYRNIYQAHHRDYYKKVQELQQQLEELKPKLEALNKLNEVTELGESLGTDLPQHYQSLLPRLGSCDVSIVTEVSVENDPACSSCRLALTQEPPAEEVQHLSRDLGKALKEQLRRLSSEAVKRVLERSNEDKVTKLLQIVHASELSSLVNVIDDEVIKFVRILLLESNIQTVAQPVLVRLADKYPVIQEDGIDEAVAEFRRLLQEAFEQAKRQNPEKRIQLSLR